MSSTNLRTAGDNGGRGSAPGSGSRRPLWRWAVNALYAAALVAMAVVPSIPSAAHDLVAVPDWTAHGIAYGVQAALLYWARLPAAGPLRATIDGVVGASAFGAVTECLQLLQPARTVELKDLAANSVGALVFCGAAASLSTLMARRRAWRSRS